jgi:hypothetical protein
LFSNPTVGILFLDLFQPLESGMSLAFVNPNMEIEWLPVIIDDHCVITFIGPRFPVGSFHRIYYQLRVEGEDYYGSGDLQIIE